MHNEQCATHNERCRGQRTWHFDQVLRRTTSGPAANGLSRFKGLLTCPFTASALHSPCLERSSFANKQKSTAEGWGLGAQGLCVEPELSPCVHKKNPHEHALSFYSAARNNIPIYFFFKKTASRKPVPPSPLSFHLKEPQGPLAPLAPPERLNSSESLTGF
jgi:hypothetical protein